MLSWSIRKSKVLPTVRYISFCVQYVITLQKAVCGFVGTHALVHFHDEETSSIVPMKRVEHAKDLLVGGPCFVV